MNKYEYVTATMEEEKERLEDLIFHLERENKLGLALDYRERYNNICKYLNAKKEYLYTKRKLSRFEEKLEELNKQKDEQEVDNILLEDTLWLKFNEDTGGKYRNILYEDIKNEGEDIQTILYLIFTKESTYDEIINKRNRLIKIIDRVKYPNTYETLINQDILIKKEESIFDDIFACQNNINVGNDIINRLTSSVMTEPILKLLYEFCIINTYDNKRVDKNKIFNDNSSLVSIKNKLREEGDNYE